MVQKVSIVSSDCSVNLSGKLLINQMATNIAARMNIMDEPTNFEALEAKRRNISFAGMMFSLL
jgi:hypothetical protein